MTEPAGQADTPGPAPLWLRATAAVAAAWAAWWLMMASHEVGHLIATLLTGGRIDRIDLSPIGFSQTHLTRTPHPAIVVWAGPVFGVLDALSGWLLARWWARSDETIAWMMPAFTFLVGFCLIANGLYIGVGWFDRVGDTGEMLRTGTPVAAMVAFGVVFTAIGLALWNQLGPWLGVKQLRDGPARALLVASGVVLVVGFLVEAGLNRLGL